jgi:RNA polymerase sigma-70 factor (ECF subfamily)
MNQAARHDDFCTLYNQTVERVYRYHLARTGSEVDAEDLTAETFHAALESYHRLRESEPPLPWLMGIARHKLADHLRRSLLPRTWLANRGSSAARRRVVPIEAAADLPQPGPSIEDQAGQRLEFSRVVGALRALNAERAEAIALHYFAGLTMDEIGQAMGKSDEAAKKLVQRGLAELRQRLGADSAGNRRAT